MQENNEFSGFYKKSREERLQKIKEFAGLSEEEMEVLEKEGNLSRETADKMIENAISTMSLPLGVAVNFRINGIERIIPMAVEEPSVIAAASNAAKIAREKGGFTAESEEQIMIGQIFLEGKNLEKAEKEIKKHKKELLQEANKADEALVKAGGGARDLELRLLGKGKKKILVVHLLVDVKDAMGANAVNSMCERIATSIEEIAEVEAKMRIVSNLAVYRKTKARAVFGKNALEESFKEKNFKGEEIAKAIISAFEFAEIDEFRACTHNKGIMNGIDAVGLAAGQDWRAIEAGAHAFAAMKGRYKPLTKYYLNKEKDLVGEIELPLAVGIVGGAIKTNPAVKVCLKILGIKSAKELAETMACVGLANNFAALRALATEGIQRGHMKLHAKNFAISAGAKGREIEIIAEKMSQEKRINAERAKEILKEIKRNKIKTEKN